MGENTKIAWCDDTFNPWWGCLKVATECKHCYAETIAKGYGRKVWGPASTTPRWLLSENNWKKPLKWNKEAREAGKRSRVFCASMADVFEDNPVLVESRERLWGIIEQTEWLNWLLLTKRPENILKMIPASWGGGVPDYVSVGTSAGTQETARKNIPELVKVKATVHFVSCEPQLEYVDMTPWLAQLEWIICGGESGNSHRTFDPDWARNLQMQCQRAQVAFFFKQHGGRYHASGGDLLDGREWKEFPTAHDRVLGEVARHAE